MTRHNITALAGRRRVARGRTAGLSDLRTVRAEWQQLHLNYVR